MRASSKILIAMLILSLLAVAAYGQATLLPPAGTGVGKAGPIQRLLKLLADPWVLIFLMISAFWAIFYFMYRIGLEKSGQVPAAYCHKLATVLSFLSVSPILWWVANAANPKALIASLTAWVGGPALGLLIFAFVIIVYNAIKGRVRAPGAP